MCSFIRCQDPAPVNALGCKSSSSRSIGRNVIDDLSQDVPKLAQIQ